MKKYVNEKFPHFVHGADYNPDQWLYDKSVWDEDMHLMKLANCNEMTVGMFSWAKLEPEEGKFDFSFLDEIIEKIHKNGGKVILGTPSGARPRWMVEKYPEVMRTRIDETRYHFASRHNHCYTSPVYREKVRIINTKLAERYGKHPAVIAWHLSNEYNGRCYCSLCEKAFKEFVRNKYDNDISKLNLAWWTAFWSHDYTSFDQIALPVKNGDCCLQGLNLDFNRFTSAQTIDFMNSEAEAIRNVCPNLPITTNMMFDVPQIDYWDMSEKLDFISLDTYPQWHSKDNIGEACLASFGYELMRSFKKKPFFVMESAPGLVNWQKYNKLKRPGMDKLSALQAVAMGSDSVQYFQWRKGRGGEEKFHGAIVDHVGNENTRIFGEISKIGATLKKIDEICGTETVASVALIFDYENRWALEGSMFFTKENKKYLDTCLNYYKALWRRGISVDMVNSHSDLSGYKLVIAPMLYMTDEKTVNNLTEYVSNGGTLYATYMLGMVNETDLCYLGGFPANNLKDVFGIWNEELDTLYPEERVRFRMNDGRVFEGMDCCEIIHSKGAETLAVYDSEFYAGEPMLTVNKYGNGKAYYQAARDDGALWDTVSNDILNELKIERALKELPPMGVTAHIRYDEETEYLFVQNYNDTHVDSLNLKGEYVNMETQERISATDIEAFGVRILKKER